MSVKVSSIVNALSSLSQALSKQRILLLTSSQGSKRRSAAYASHVLRNQLGSNVQTATVSEPSISALKDGLDILKRTQCSTIIGLGGSMVLDSAKFMAGIQEDKDIRLVLIPTIPAGGKEVHNVGELFDWEKEERTVLELPSSVFATIVDPELALEDKITKETDYSAFLYSLALILNHSDDYLQKNEELLRHVREAIKTLLDVSPTAKSLPKKVRESMFSPQLMLTTGSNVVEEHGLDAILANIINPRVALPRTAFRAGILIPCVQERMKQSKEFEKAMIIMTGCANSDEAIKLLLNIQSRSSLQGGVRQLLRKRMDEKSIDALIKNAGEWMEEYPGNGPLKMSPELINKIFT